MLKRELVEGVTVVTLDGSCFANGEQEELCRRTLLRMIADEGVTRMILRFDGSVTQLSAKALGDLLKLNRLLSMLKGRLVLSETPTVKHAPCNYSVMDVFTLTRTDCSFRMAQTFDEAMRLAKE